MPDASSTDKSQITTPAERRRQGREEMITAILDVSRSIMREEGAAALSLNEVARRVGVRTPSLYVYFASKSSIYDALFLLGVRTFRAQLNSAMSEPLPLWQSLRVALETHMSFAHDHPELYQIVFERPIPGFQPSEQSMAESWEMLADGYKQVEAAFRAEGINPPLPIHQLTDLFIALQHGLTALHMANEPALPTGEGRFGALIPAAIKMLEAAWGTSSQQQYEEEE